MVFHKTVVDWSEIRQNIELIHNRTATLDKGNIAIIGIARGGLIPATLLSQLKENSTVFSIGIKSYNKTSRSKEIVYQDLNRKSIDNYDTIYLIDDISDTGLTFRFLLDKYFTGLSIKTISLFLKAKSLYKPDFYGTELLGETWVVFPWEKE